MRFPDTEEVLIFENCPFRLLINVGLQLNVGFESPLLQHNQKHFNSLSLLDKRHASTSLTTTLSNSYLRFHGDNVYVFKNSLQSVGVSKLKKHKWSHIH